MKKWSVNLEQWPRALPFFKIDKMKISTMRAANTNPRRIK
jgi:hypothetical protein